MNPLLLPKMYFRYWQRRVNDRASSPQEKMRLLPEGTAGQPLVILLGDSVAERVAKDDRDSRSLYEITSQELAGRCRTGCITHSAYHMGVFYYYWQILARRRPLPKIVVLPVNMRSFSPQWDWNPLYQCAHHLDELRKLLSVPEMAVKNGNGAPPTIWNFYHAEVHYPLCDLLRISDFLRWIEKKPHEEKLKLLRLRIIFIFHYLYPLDSSHWKLSLLREIVAQAHAAGSRLLVYTLPLNVDAGVRLLGPDFRALVQANVEIVRQAVEAGPENEFCCFRDFSLEFSPIHFFHDYEPTEHLNEAGRRRLGMDLARLITAMLSSPPC